MAGVKITDLTPLATAVSGDLLYIVDISDTTESPQGTSKSVEVGTLFERGTWIPTFSGGAFSVTNPVLDTAIYSRVGNIVTCSIAGFVDVDFTGVFISGYFTFTFPIPISASPNSIGIASLNLSNQVNGLVKENFIQFDSSDLSLVSNSVEFYATFQYEII